MTDSPGDSSAEPERREAGHNEAGQDNGHHEPASHEPAANHEPSHEPADHEPSHEPSHEPVYSGDPSPDDPADGEPGTYAWYAGSFGSYDTPPADTTPSTYPQEPGGYSAEPHPEVYHDDTAAGGYPKHRGLRSPADSTWFMPQAPPPAATQAMPPATQAMPAGPPAGPPPGTPPGAPVPGPVPGLPPLSTGPGEMPRAKRKLRPPLLIAAAVLVIIAAAAVSYALLHTRGSPQQAAQDYLTAWQADRMPDMQKVSVGVPSGGLAHPVKQAEADLGVHAKTLQLGSVQKDSASTAHAGFTARLTLGNGIHWSYQGRLQLVRRSRHWRVAWTEAAIHPQLRSGERFHVAARWLPRAAILAADGTRLDSSQALQESGSIEMITGSVGPLTAAQAKHLGAPYRAGDMAGQGGIEQADERRLAGTPRSIIELVDAHGRVQHTLASFGGKPGTAVKTSIDMHLQQAASRAVASASVGSKPVALVAIRPSTGDVLAVVNKPGGFDRALLGTYPPGSTFKMITASALAENGMRPSDSVPCPATINIGGRTFHNYDYEKLGSTNLQTAFAVSCNTTFAQLGSQRLTGGKLAAMASQFGFGTTPKLGIPAALGHFSTPSDSTGLAADSFGQGQDIVNPLQLATVAGALGNGSWRSPRLVLDPAPAHIPPPHQLDPTVTSVLRPMMAAVVSQGTAAHVGFPPGVYGKTGTAEYGQGSNPPSHAWFAGYQGDLAFAVIVEGGGVGADASGPIANAFLRGK